MSSTPARPHDADLPIWFSTNRRRYHKRSDVNSSLCASDRRPTRVPCGPLPAFDGRIVVCDLCEKLVSTGPLATIANGFQEAREFVGNDISPIAHLATDDAGQPTALAPFVMLVGFVVGGILGQFGPEETLKICLDRKYEYGKFGAIKDGWRRVLDLAVEQLVGTHVDVDAAIRWHVKTMGRMMTNEPAQIPAPVPKQTGPVYAIEIVPAVTGQVLGLELVPSRARAIFLASPDAPSVGITEIMESIVVARDYVKTKYPTATEISYEAMMERTKLTDEQLIEAAAEELADLDSIEGLDDN